MLNANAQALLAAGIFPAPTNGTKFQGSPATPTDVREEIVRIDHEFNEQVLHLRTLDLRADFAGIRYHDVER